MYGRRHQTLFLQGCAGNIRPNLPGFPYRCGDEADIRWIGRDLGCEVVRAADHAAVREELAKRPEAVPDPVRVGGDRPARQGEAGPREFQALRVGPFLFLTIPGEPFVEYGFQIEKVVGDRAIPIVVGYANGNVQYVCTDQAYKEGGYEPNMTPLAAGVEPIIVNQVTALADRVIGDIFESFAPRLPVDNKTLHALDAGRGRQEVKNSELVLCHG